MAERQIIPIDRVVKCHVNSVDGSPTYESGIAYKAGTLVILDDTPYTAIVDIADDDSDTPDLAPEKWAMTPNAFREGSGGDGGLSARVTALENTIDNKFLLTESITSLQEKADGTKTVGQILDDLAADVLAAAAELSDDQFIDPMVLFCGGYAWCGSVGANYITNETTSFNIPFDRSVISSGDLYHFVAMFADGTDNTNKLTRCIITSTPTVTIYDCISDVPAANTTFEIQYRIWTKATS